MFHYQLLFRDAACNFAIAKNMSGNASHKVLRICNDYWKTGEVFKNFDVVEIIMGMMSQVSERKNMSITPDLMGESLDLITTPELMG